MASTKIKNRPTFYSRVVSGLDELEHFLLKLLDSGWKWVMSWRSVGIIILALFGLSLFAMVLSHWIIRETPRVAHSAWIATIVVNTIYVLIQEFIEFVELFIFNPVILLIKIVTLGHSHTHFYSPYWPKIISEHTIKDVINDIIHNCGSYMTVGDVLHLMFEMTTSRGVCPLLRRTYPMPIKGVVLRDTIGFLSVDANPYPGGGNCLAPPEQDIVCLALYSYLLGFLAVFIAFVLWLCIYFYDRLIEILRDLYQFILFLSTTWFLFLEKIIAWFTD